MKFGLLLPHFGVYADKDRLLDGARLAEDFGFDSVWVRDHLIFEPHGEMEDPNRSFYDALITLTAIGAVTSKIELGTGSLIPFRHPLEVALSVATMTQLVGPRVILGYGAGTFDHEFEAIGIDPEIKRWHLVKSTALILRKVWQENAVEYKDEFYSFEDVTIEPKPVGGPVPFWYCGTSVEATREEALRDVNVDGLLTWANKAKYWVKPPSGRFESWEDLEGVLIAGSPEDVVEEVLKFQAAGCEHLVFDFRFKFDRFFEQIELLGKEVLPRLRKAEVAA
jgi:alkanesulfonate monooxygenase SsuD/methylene tetrahydromethanopterin reductase-like flavin-dependent oxidoreductase (luciferase family)